MPATAQSPRDPFTDCLEACQQCAAACQHCATACLQEPDVAKMVRCIRLDLDCADACLMAAGAMARASVNIEAFCGLCAELCDACGEECAHHPMDHCQRCAEACRRCADACRAMSGSGGGRAGRDPSTGRGAHAH